MTAKVLVTTVLITTAAVLLAQPTDKPRFSLTLDVKVRVIKSGTSIPFTVTTKNISEGDMPIPIIPVGPKEIQRLHDVVIYDESGRRLPESIHGMSLHRRAPGKVEIPTTVARGELKPGEHFDEAGDLNTEFHITKPGKYTAQAEKRDPETRIIVKSNTVSFTVEP